MLAPLLESAAKMGVIGRDKVKHLSKEDMLALCGLPLTFHVVRKANAKRKTQQHVPHRNADVQLYSFTVKYNFSNSCPVKNLLFLPFFGR